MDDRGPAYAERSARGIGMPGGERRTGHLSTLQRVSRAADGTPLHVRIDGPGFDELVAKHRVPEQSNGLERFLTCTRRQNFLVPPRRHRAFPLVELA